MEMDEVWSDGSRIFISRGEEFDSLVGSFVVLPLYEMFFQLAGTSLRALIPIYIYIHIYLSFLLAIGHNPSTQRKIPIQKVRTDPSWLEKSVARTRTENLAVFINADMFSSIVCEFIEDWAPACDDLVQAFEMILKESLAEALEEGFGPVQRYPRLVNMVEKQCRQAVSQLVADARRLTLEHLEAERFPFTQDDTLLDRMKELRLAQIRKDLETQLRLDQEGVVFDSGALNTIIDRVFTRASRRNFLGMRSSSALSF